MMIVTLDRSRMSAKLPTCSYLPYSPEGLITQFSAFPCILWNPQVHYPVHNSPPFVPFLRQIIQVHALAIDFFKVHFNTTLQITRRRSQWSVYVRFLHQKSVRSSPNSHAYNLSRPSHSKKITLCRFIFLL